MERFWQYLIAVFIVANYYIPETYTDESILEDDVTFYLYTNSSPSEGVYLDPSSLEELDNINSVAVLIHGYNDNRNKSLWYEPLRNVLLQQTEDIGVIEVDYERIASLDYVSAVLLSKGVGNTIGDFLVLVNDYLEIGFEFFRIYGHSMGAQVSGFSGRRIQEAANSTIAKIIAMDPAGPLYSDLYRIEKTDASVVEVIHSDMGGFGYDGEIGTIDFYPNGGRAVQPGCPSIAESIIDYYENDTYIYCSHGRSLQFYIEALKYGGFTSQKCSSYLVFLLGLCDSNEKLGLADDITTADTGKYYLYTNSESPFSKG